MAKTLISDPIWDPQYLPLLAVRQSSKLSSYAISRKTYEPNLKKQQKKTIFRPHFGPFSPHVFLVFRHCSKLSSNAV